MWCSLQQNISHTLQNWDTQRPYSARLDERIQGFTEEWDNLESSKLEETANSTKCPQPPAPAPAPHRTFGSEWDQHCPECHIRLHQYRPAWFEQLVLRVSKIPYIVINSSYAVTEVTGPLPLLQDFEGGSSPPSRDNQDSPPAMVGRYQIVSDGAIQNSILDYLKIHRGVDLDSVLENEEQKIQQSASFVAIIRDTLSPCLVALRYNADPMAWEQIYRPQCIAATTTGSSNGWKSRPLLARWQAWSEKVHAVANLSSSQRRWNKETIIETVRRTYAILEHQLQKINLSDSKQYLLGTEKPTIVDCLLWDHLMEALADVHLVIVLADFPELLKFTQTIWDRFSFGTIVEEVGVVQGSSVGVWNMEENAMNAFASIPLLPESKRVETDSAYRAGIDMMHNLRMLQNDLGKSLVLIKQQHNSISYQRHGNQPLATWHRWRMGGGYLPNQPATGRSGTPTTEEMTRRQYQRNDEIWMMSVVATTVIAMVGFGLVG